MSDRERWLGFLSTFYLSEIEKLVAGNQAAEGGLDVHLGFLAEHEPELAGIVGADPDAVSDANEALWSIIKTNFGNVTGNYAVAIVGKPANRKIPIGELGSQYVGRRITIDGLIKKTTPLIPTLMVADFKCRDCGKLEHIPQSGDKVIKPGTCSQCGSSNAWILQTNTSIYEDFQRVQIQERPDTMDGGRQPEKVVMELKEDMLKTVVPGDRVEATGTLKFKQEKASREMKSVFEVESISHHDKDYSEVEVTQEFAGKAKEFAEAGNVIPRLVDNIATSIYGMKFEKTAILLSLFGGCQRKRQDGSSRRGHIHVLMAGDPGTAKSMLLRYFNQITPRGVLATGKGASAVGLCVSGDTVIRLACGNSDIRTIANSVTTTDYEMVEGGYYRARLPDGFVVDTWANGQYVPVPVTWVWKITSRPKKYRITLESGKQIVVTGSTVLRTSLGWVAAKDLNTGDAVTVIGD